MHAGPSRATLSIAVTQESGCGDCAGVRTTDACLIGSWQLVGGGAAEWMRRQGIPITASVSNQTITFRRDGTYITGAVQGQAEIELREGRGEGEIAAQAGGRWSTNGGVLNLCADMQALAGRATVHTPSGSRTMPIGPAPPVNSSERYTCGGDSFHSERDIPGGPPMPFQYARTGGG
jgi:hypothetical protein